MPRTVTAHAAREASHPMPLDAAAIEAALGTERWIYLVIGPGTWGKGFDQDAAHAAAGKPKQRIVIAAADPWTYVDGMGSITYTPRDPDHAPAQRNHQDWIEVSRTAPRKTR